jgi:NitT/TauT family transport system ATP-binding protein
MSEATGPAAVTLYAAQELAFAYPATGQGEQTLALSGIDLAIRAGEFLSIVGPSGCGKTSLLKLLTGLQHPTSGRLLFRGAPVTAPPPGIGMAFQDALLLPWRSVIDNILLPVEILRRPRKDYLARARELLATVGLDGAENRNVWELSGGMRQRVSLCRALITDPAVLLLDEPFAALDAFTREDLWLVLQTLQAKTGSTMVLITHQLAEAVFLSDRVIVLSKRPGTIVHEERVELPRPRDRADAYTPDFIAVANRLRLKIEH